MGTSSVSNNGIMKINKIKSIAVLESLKSKYILQKIFDNLSKDRAVKIIKFNKKLQERLDMINNEYQNYIDYGSDIELEIIPDEMEYGQFININNEEKNYYHIYFDNNKEEIKRVYFNKNEPIKKIKIIIDYQVISFQNLFNSLKSIKSITFKKFYRKNIKNMSQMFFGCSSLKELNLSNFNTINVTDMGSMFSGCSSLKELDLSNFNTNNVTNMKEMFSQCHELKIIKGINKLIQLKLLT